MKTFWAILTIVIMFFQNFFTGGTVRDNITREAELIKDRKEILNTKYEGEPSKDIFDPDAAFNEDEVFTLEKQPGKEFVILNFTDMHFSDYDYRTLFAFDAERTAKKLVKQYSPDLITVTGDNVCGDSTKGAIERFTALIDSFGIPWAPVFGNHDNEANCDHNYLADVMMRSENCLFRKGDPAMGCGNYIINITENGKVVETLFMTDSHRTQWNTAQVEWFTWAADGLRNAGKLGETSVFCHIPLPEYQYAYDAAWDAGKRNWRSEYLAGGELHEEICCERDGDRNPLQRGVFSAIKEAGTSYIFCGHEHMNDFSIMYDGIRVTYCLKMDKSSGFHPGFDGGTIIRIGAEGISSITHRTVAGIDRDLMHIDTK